MNSTTQDAALNAFANLAVVARNRGDLYQLLAIGFSDPTEHLIDGLLSGTLHSDAVDCVRWLGADSALFGVPLKAFEAFTASNAARDRADLLREFKVEYARLFIGPRAALVSPYESVHCDAPDISGAVLLRGPSATRTAQAYAEAGLHLAADCPNPPDHIATELEFVYYLCQQEALAWEEGNNTMSRNWRRREREFVDNHLGKWGSQFCRQVVSASKNGFYVALASFGATFLEIEKGAFKPS